MNTWTFVLGTSVYAAALLTSAVSLASVPARAAVDWNALLDRGMPKDLEFGVVIGGANPFTRNASVEMAPASLSKLLTSGTALSRLGPDFRYATSLRWRQGANGSATNVELIGSGDPTWAMEEYGLTLDSSFEPFAAALEAAGVSEVDAKIELVADPSWQTLSFPSGWKKTDATTCDGAIGQAFNLSANCAIFEIKSATHGAWQSAGVDVPVTLDLKSASATDITPEFAIDAGRPSFVLHGTVGRHGKRVALPVHDTRSWGKALFLKALSRHGIRVRPLTLVGPATDHEFIFHSPTLAVILQPLNKNSINVIADVLLKTLGAQTGATDLRAAGLDAIRSFLTSAGLQHGYQINDGSGLSRTSKLTAQFLYDFLNEFKTRPEFPALLKALPIAGVDGTLKSRMKGTAAEGRLHAKTGTLDGVYNLAGFVPSGHDYVPFVILSRTAPGRAAIVHVAEDRVGAELAKLHAPNFVPEILSEQAPIYPFVKEHSGENHE